KPRYEPLVLLAALSQRTHAIELGTACLVTSQRHPLQLAQAWATIDMLAGGRTILGACAGNVIEDAVKCEFDALGLDHRHRLAPFEEGLMVVRQLLESGRAKFDGRRYQLDVGFHTGTEPAPLLPARVPPIWVVANPGIGRRAAPAIDRAVLRVASLG